VSLTVSDAYSTITKTREEYIFMCNRPLPDFSVEDICLGEEAVFIDESQNLNLKDSLVLRYASSLIGFSSQWGPLLWGAIQTLGEPDVYPAYADSNRAWAPQTPNGPCEWIELGYDDPKPISAIWIYETLKPGTVDTVYAKNPTPGHWEILWSGTAAPAPLEARIFKVEFEETPYPVSSIRIAMHTAMVSYWNEIDAVAVITNLGPYPCGETAYEWDIDNNGIIDYTTKGDIVHFYEQPGLYDAKLRIINNGVCEDEIIRSLSVNTQPEFTQEPSALTVCSGTEAVFSCEATMTGSFGVNYQWYGPGGIMTGENQTQLLIDPATADDAGDYYVVAYNDCGSEISVQAT